MNGSIVPRVVVLLGIAALTLAFAAPETEVDFAKPPEQGKQFKVTEKVNVVFKMKVTINGEEQEIDVTQKQSEVFTQKILAVKDGKIRQVEREYEDATASGQATPLSWKRIRGAWDDDGELTLTMHADETWKPAPDSIRAFLTPGALLQPIAPFSKGVKKPGMTWEVDEKLLKKYFAPMRFGSPDATVSGEWSFIFEGVSEIRGMKCAVLKHKLQLDVQNVQGGGSVAFTITGPIHYSLDHRFVVGMKAKGKISQEGAQDLDGTMDVEYKVKPLAEKVDQ